MKSKKNVGQGSRTHQKLFHFLCDSYGGVDELKQKIPSDLTILYHAIGQNRKSVIAAIQDTFRKNLKSFEENKNMNYGYILKGLYCIALQKIDDQKYNSEKLKALFNSKKIQNEFDGYGIEKFLFYYWKKETQVASLDLFYDRNKVLEKISLQYLSKEDNYALGDKIVSSELEINMPTNYIYALLRKDDLAVQLVIQANEWIVKSTINFCSYSSVDGKSLLSSGIGILQNISALHFALHSLRKEGVNPLISNNLYLKSEELDSDELEIASLDNFTNKKEIEFFENIQGSWIGIYMRSDKPDGKDEEKGGVETIKLEIQPDGYMKLFGTEYIPGRHADSYEGFGSFPRKDNSGLLKANFKLIDESKIYSIHLFLTNIDNEVLKGVISGWSDKFLPFGGAILFKKENRVNVGIKMKRKQEIDFNVEDAGLFNRETLNFFLNKDKYLNLPQDCLSENYSFYDSLEVDKARNLAGSYFLFSYNRMEGTILKLKVVINIQGFVSIQNHDTFYKGVAFCRKFDNNDESYLIFDLFERVVNGKKEKYWGHYLFQLENFMSQSGNYEEIAFVPGISLRINNNGEPQSKKEYLIPALNEDIFSEAEKFEYNYSEDKIQNVRGGDDIHSSTFQALIKFISSLKGKNDNILKVQQGAFNNLETNSAHRRNNYHEIYFNCFIISGAFGDTDNESTKLKCREYLVESILHGLDLVTMGSSLYVFYKKFFTSIKTRDEIQDCSLKIAEVVQTFNKENKNDILKKLILLREEPTSTNSIAFCAEVSRLICLLPLIVNKD